MRKQQDSPTFGATLSGNLRIIWFSQSCTSSATSTTRWGTFFANILDDPADIVPGLYSLLDMIQMEHKYKSGEKGHNYGSFALSFVFQLIRGTVRETPPENHPGISTPQMNHHAQSSASTSQQPSCKQRLFDELRMD